jgi:uncharacterized protein
MTIKAINVRNQFEGTVKHIKRGDVAEVNLLIVPGFHGSGDAHWQTWLEAEQPNARRVAGIDWERPVVADWANAIAQTLDEVSGPTVIVAHSFGCLASALAIASRPNLSLGALFVAPARPERFTRSGVREDTDARFPSIAADLPDGSLNIPGLVVGSRNDPWMKLQHAYAWSRRWSLAFHDAGEVGHINVESGFGPWPWVKFIAESLGDYLLGEVARQSGPDGLAQWSGRSLPEPKERILFYA